MKHLRGVTPGFITGDTMFYELRIWDGSCDFDTRHKIRIATKDSEDLFVLADEEFDRFIRDDPHINWYGQLYEGGSVLRYERLGNDELWDEATE